MSAKSTRNSNHLTGAAGRCSHPPPVRPYLPPHLWLVCTAALTLCLVGCPTPDVAEPTGEQRPDVGSTLPVGPPDKDPLTQINSIEPVQGPNGGGTRMTIRGSGLSNATKVFLGETAASNVTVVDEEMITAMTPAHSEGEVTVSVQLDGGARLEAVQRFFYVDGYSCDDYDPAIDSDGDGLADGLETCGWRIAVDLCGFGTDNPSGLYYNHVVSNPTDADTDHDGLSDYEEYLIGCDPNFADTDLDGLNDAEEVHRWLTSPVSVDSDGDANGDNDALPPNASLFDGAELKIDFEHDPTHTPAIDATSPTSPDTDGDGRSDYEELGHPVLSPVIADLPALELQVVDEIDVLLNVEYAEEAGTSTEYGTSFSRATTTSEHWYTGGTLQVGMGASVTVGAEGGFPTGVSAKAEATVSMDVSYSQEWQVGGETSEELRNEYSRLQGKSRTHTETVSSGAISTGIVLTNTGPVSYRLTDLGMTVRLFERGTDPDDPLYVGSFKTVATLVPVLGENGFTLAPGQSTPVLQVQAQNVNVDRIKDFLRDPHALHLEQAYFQMETADGLDYGFVEEATRANTATITVDFGDGEWHKYRLATNVNRDANGNTTGVRMADALEVVGIAFQTAMKYADPGHTVPICRVLTHVQKEDGTWLPEDPDPYSIDRYAMWTVFGTNDDFENDTLDFEDVVLHAGDAAMLVFSVDADHDGVYGWDEDHYGSSDNPGNGDYDGDGLTDDEEVNPQPDPNDPDCFVPAGWDVQVGDDPPYRAFSDPRLADGDEDGLTDSEEKLGRDGLPPGDPGDTGDATDPNKRDTDADGIDDAADAWPLNPAHILRVDDDSAGGDGSTWGTAYSSLQTAIGVAQSANADTNPTNDITEIWVAEGDYEITSDPQPMLSHVGYYGGFVGGENGETKRAQRSSSLGSRIDGTASNYLAFGVTAATETVLDGFQISSYHPGRTHGGAMCLIDCENVVIRNVLFIGNSVEAAGGEGGALAVQGGSITLEDCIFANNQAHLNGGAVQFETATATVRNCLFQDNFAGDNTNAHGGGATYFSNCNAHISNSRFVSNELGPMGTANALGKWGGAIFAMADLNAQPLYVENCVFSDNRVRDEDDLLAGGGAIYAEVRKLALVNCLFNNNVIDTGTGLDGIYPSGCAVAVNSPGDAYVTNCTFVDNYRMGQMMAGAQLLMLGSGAMKVVNVITAWDVPEEQFPDFGIYLYYLTPRFMDRICFAPEVEYPDDDPLWDSDANITTAFPAGTMELDPSEDVVFENWPSSDLHLAADCVLIDWGTNYVDVDPTTAGYQFLPEYDLDGNPRIVDGDGTGVATVDIGAYEYSPY